jgi:putative DNA methylase
LALYKGEIEAIEDATLHGAMTIIFCKMLDWNSRLCLWNPMRDQTIQVFYNQALNTLVNYGVRATSYIETVLTNELTSERFAKIPSHVAARPAAMHSGVNDLYITDPPYGDAVNYHEITEFFIAWMRKNPPRCFREWTWDSRRALAIRGNGIDFRKSMVQAYQSLADNMPANGMQIVMFTHNSPAVWAGITMILWAAGLQVTAAWCIATEASSNIKQGNFVQGTVLLVLRTRFGTDNAWSNRLGRKIRSAIEIHIEPMTKLDDKERPNFTDADYQLGGYAAALEVLTQHKTLDNQDVMSELLSSDHSKTGSSIEKLLEDAKRVASEFLIPKKLDTFGRSASARRPSAKDIWSDSTAEERFFLKGLELESNGECRIGAYQDIARGFGVEGYRTHMGVAKANNARLKTACEWKGTQLTKRGDSVPETEGFGSSVVRHAFYGIYLAMEEDDLRVALNWFQKSMPDYWNRRKRLIGVLEYLATATTSWRADEANTARKLAGAVLNHGL